MKEPGASRPQRSSSAMCDYSLHHVKSRPAKVGDKLTTVNFNTGTRGFASPDDRTTAVCILPGTELAFSEEVKCGPAPFGFTSWRTKTINFRTAIFRQVNKDQPRMHHDALEFPDGQTVLLTDLREGQEAVVLQLPAQPKTPAEEAAEGRSPYVGQRSPLKSRRHCRRLCFFHSSASSFRILDRPRPTRASTSPMKLFYAPGSSSLLPHIVLHEAGLPFTAIKVDE